MAMQVDLELKKAFQELQVKMVTSTQQIKVSDAQIDQLKRSIKHSELVEHEIGALPDSTRLYEGVGRMFILQPHDSIKKNLANKKKGAEEKIKNLETSKSYLEKSIKESEDNLRELVMSKQQNR
ncbi:prefoldin subunit 1-like [Crassostrea angulata]|uniref:Prefoldin subunit 1 n=1 Tax=Magallana gigas TaxID=29159 RepID=K1P6Q5_MAGGI|nr:prefoldin subunit 1 [Crassostrea gigas]XP_034312615.1 prefoldin subunit 1-like [Crassostrea gigas]XP_052687403.1 prefoldin subunit 1-like [Crassostrea angulata]|eukprot:XP_011423835.1 PREDICTED: prefoldin subunit 1 [Crassostrea gigas]